MKIKRAAQAGSVESGDILIIISPGDEDTGIGIILESPVKALYGDKIETEIRSVLSNYNVKNANILATDRGALNFTVISRTETAIKRAIEED